MASTPTRITVDQLEEVRVTGGGGAGTNVNISGVNGSPPAMSNPLPVELSDGTNPFGTAGNPLSVNVLSGGGSNSSVGTNNNPAPGSSTQVGSIDGSGNLQAASSSNPLPVSVISSLLSDPAEGVPGAAPPAKAIQIAGSDGTALRTVLTDSTGVVQVNSTTSATSLASTQSVDAPLTSQLYDVMTQILAEVRATRILLSIMASETNAASEADFDPLNYPKKQLEFVMGN